MADKRTGDAASKIEKKGKTLSIRTKVDLGEQGIPLDHLPELHKKLRDRNTQLLDAVQQMNEGRNAPCPCGSGKKFKRCCGAGQSLARVSSAPPEAGRTGLEPIAAGDRRKNISALAASQVSILDEAEYIANCALHHDARVVTLGHLVFFSSDTGDAWMLDPEDGYARCLARDGKRLPKGITETRERFAIEWNADYHIEGDSMILTNRSGGEHAVTSYPADEICRAIRRMRRGR